eukprot:scaffold9628_cov43-Prasinocladus_malaysianus.AAC.1
MHLILGFNLRCRAALHTSLRTFCVNLRCQAVLLALAGMGMQGNAPTACVWSLDKWDETALPGEGTYYRTSGYVPYGRLSPFPLEYEYEYERIASRLTPAHPGPHRLLVISDIRNVRMRSGLRSSGSTGDCVHSSCN